MLTEFLQKGATIRVCGSCVKTRGLNKEEPVAGVEIGTMVGLAQRVKESRHVLTF